MSPETSTSVLLHRYRSGDRESLSRLIARLAPRLYVWAAVRIPEALWHRLHPEDFLQDVWQRTLDAMERFDDQRGAFRTWVFGIASRTLAEKLRHWAMRRREGGSVDEAPSNLDQLPGDVTSVVRTLARRERFRLLLDAIERLPPLDRQLVIFRGIERLPYEEIAARLGKSAVAWEARWRRVRATLKRGNAE